LPDSDIARKKALNKALDKMEGLDPADNILSPETSARLIIAAAKYNDGFKAITVSSSAYHRGWNWQSPNENCFALMYEVIFLA